MMLIVAMIGILSLIGSEVAAQDTIPEIVQREQRPVETYIIREFSPVRLGDLVAASEVIGRVVVVEDGHSRMTDDMLSLVTDYKVQVVETYLTKKALDVGQIIVVTKPGGEMTIEGFPVATYERDFPPFLSGEEYILFLRFDPRSSTFSLPDGGQGAFRNQGGAVEQVSTKFGTWNREHGRLALSGFKDELRRALGDGR